MIPAIYPITVAANARWNDPFTCEWIADHTGYSARIVFTATNAADASPLLTLNSAGASPTITLSTSSLGMVITPNLTSSAMDTLRAAAITAGVAPNQGPYTGYTIYYGLKIIPASGEDDADIPVYGPFEIRDTPPA